MENNKTIVILGRTGTLGTSFQRIQHDFQSVNFFFLGREEVDFEDNPSKLIDFFSKVEPDTVINCVGLVGGIKSNIENPTTLMFSNGKTTLNIAEAALTAKIQNYIYFAPACIYPTKLNGNSIISDLWSGPPEVTSRPYASAKLMGMELVKSINREFNTNWKVYIPTNIFGIGDWRHGESGHAVSMITDKILAARKSENIQVKLWGTGNAYRDFLFADDLAKLVICDVTTNLTKSEIVNVSGYGITTIADISRIIATKLDYSGAIVFDKYAPEGPRFKSLESDPDLQNFEFDHNLNSALNVYLSHRLRSF